MIEIKDLSLTFKNADEDHEALKAVTLDIPEGCIYGFVGSNGAGKSTLLRVISGIYRPDSGSVTIDKTEVYDRPQAKENIFFVSDETVQFSRLTVNDLKSFYQAATRPLTTRCSMTLSQSLTCHGRNRCHSFQRA